jgi:hypothetical protein
MAFTTGFLLGPASGGLALGAGEGTGLFAVMLLACALAAAAAVRLDRHLPAAANQVTSSAVSQRALALVARVTIRHGLRGSDAHRCAALLGSCSHLAVRQEETPL